MDVEIDPGSTVPPFEQLRSQVAGQVAAGTLPAGTRLPTVRRLAEDLGLAVNTVARAYRELEADGITVTRGRRGTFVASTVLTSSSEMAGFAQEYVDRARRAGLTRAEATLLVEQTWER